MRTPFWLIVSFILITISSFSQITRQEYIDKYKDLAIREMNRVGIPASITLAQGLLESANGNSRIAVKANNHFGIKCHSSWTGKTIRRDDDKKNECFRKYKTAYDSYMDHSNFLTKGPRYAFLFEYKTTDYKKWAKGLKKAGYATSNTYASRLIKIIEDNKLYLYDTNNNAIAQKNNPTIKEKKNRKTRRIRKTKEDYAIQLGRKIKTNNRVKFIVAKKGDSYTKLIDEFQLLRFELYHYNDAKKGDKIKTGDIVYLQPKRNKSEKGKDFHTVKKGESIKSISQKYAIKSKKLRKRNHLEKTEKLKVGQKLKLR